MSKGFEVDDGVRVGVVYGRRTFGLRPRQGNRSSSLSCSHLLDQLQRSQGVSQSAMVPSG